MQRPGRSGPLVVQDEGRSAEAGLAADCLHGSGEPLKTLHSSWSGLECAHCLSCLNPFSSFHAHGLHQA